MCGRRPCAAPIPDRGAEAVTLHRPYLRLRPSVHRRLARGGGGGGEE